MQQNVHKDSLDLMDIDPELNLYSIENVYPIYVLLPRTALDATAPRDPWSIPDSFRPREFCLEPKS